ncbi:MAG: alpha/beta fold hydrolase [Methylotenera sp.]|nr:alpha/beta fold hydrolase [Methylotenera sp.]MSP99483.1 alpha/beta fold hydrolase [Methylotenera sp.]
MNYKPPLESSSSNNSKINASVIWLHGLGADGYDFEPIVQKLDLPNVRFILPHAPDMAVTRNSGYIMPAWYDLYGLTGNSQEDESGIATSQKYVNALIQHELNRGVASERIVLAGFSQGGAIALHTAIRYPEKLGGILALSTYLPLNTKLTTEVHRANAGIPIFMAHGVFDEVISLEMCKRSLNILQHNHYAVNWHEYNMAHSVCVDEINDIRLFLKHVLLQDLVE